MEFTELPKDTMPPREEPAELQEPLLPESSEDTFNSEENDPKNITLSCCSRRFSMNHNVVLNLVLCITYGVSDSLWSGTVIAAYLKKMGHSHNSWVGNVEAANGLASLFSALPVGYLADKWGRSNILRVGGVLLIGTAVLHAMLMTWLGTDEHQEHAHSELFLAGIMALWGIGGGVVMGPSQALFADSTPQGKRSQYFTYLFVCYMVASCMGPFVSIILFQTLGDDWDLYDLRTIIYVGLAMEAGNGFLMMFFDDKKALEESESQWEEEEETDNLWIPDEEQPQQTPTPADDDHTQVVENTTNKKYKAWIPYILFVHNLILALGSGMTVKFFPLFFKDQVGMSPTQVQIVYILVPLVLASCSGLGQKLSSKGGLGRVPTALIFKLFGVSLLYTMVFFKGFLDQRPLLLVPIYIIRTALMNASYPLEESILMDNVPKNERGRWKSLESIAMFGWCGSAALGGWASDHAHGDYTYTFLLTAIIQTVGSLVWCLLWPLVSKEDDEPQNDEPQQQYTPPQQSEPLPDDRSLMSEEDFFFDALEDMPISPPVETSARSSISIPYREDTLQSKFPTLNEETCNRFQKMFVDDKEVHQKLKEYVQFRALYKLATLGPGIDDAADWKWAAQLAVHTARTHRGDMLPGVEGLAFQDRVCQLEQLPQLCFAHKCEDGSPALSECGNPIVHYLAGRLDNDAVSPEIHAVSISLYLEQKVQQLDFNGNGAVLMVDARKGRGWPNHSVLMVAGFLKILTKALHKIHPGRMQKLIIYPVPFAGVYAFKVMKRWLPKEIAENIILVNGSDGIDSPVPKKELSKYVAVEILDQMEEVRRANFDE